MDLNYLYQRLQVSSFMAENASSEEARHVHREFADRYAAQIADAKNSPKPTRAASWSS